jgi:hypothetical protein
MCILFEAGGQCHKDSISAACTIAHPTSGAMGPMLSQDFFKGDFLAADPQIKLCSVDAGIAPKKVATLALAVRRSKQLTRYHPLHGQISSTVRLDLIHDSAVSPPRMAISHPQVG